ncbi:MAG: thioredoxin family protein [Phycisphaerales bacterium]
MKFLRPISLVLIFVVTVIIIHKLTGAGTAPIPEVFSQRLSLDAAIERARIEKKPVFVFATASWCMPCQEMKRTILSEPSVETQIARDFIPAYVDLDEQKDAAQRLQVFSIPATLILWDGKLVARMEGLIPHDSYLKWLDAAHALATSDTPFIERASDEFGKNPNSEGSPKSAAPAPNSQPPGAKTEPVPPASIPSPPR